MRSGAITVNMLREAWGDSAPKYGVPSRANDRRSARARGMSLSPARAVRPLYAVTETLTTVAERWLAERIEPRRSPKTAASYRRAIQRLASIVGDVPVDALTQSQIAAALGCVPEGSRPADFSAWSACLRWRGRPDLVAEIDRPQTRRREAVLDVDDLRHFMAALGMARSVRGRKWTSRTIVDLILFALLVPMREEEICRLRREDVDLGSRLATIREHKTARFVGARRVPIGKLGASILAGRPPGPYFFAASRPSSAKVPHVSGTTVSTAARRILDRYAAATGRPWHRDTCFHTLRHTYASHALAMGVSIENVRQICGWSSAWMMDRYAHILSDAGSEMDRVQARLTEGLRMQLSIATT